MATKIYLGEPPATIKQWIIEHYGKQIPEVYSITGMVQFNEINQESDTTLLVNDDGTEKATVTYKTIIDGITNN